MTEQRTHISLFSFSLFCFSLLFCFVGFSQENELKPTRPKVALVLSGGGAKGFAHIGVLKVLEEEGIPIDLIVGTSMGSLVGGIYSTGYKASELEELVKSLDWKMTFSDDIPRQYLSRNDQMLQQRYIFSLPVSGSIKPSLPQGLIKGQNVMNIFCSLAGNVPADADFQKFPIPFACIATDLETGKEIVLKDGFLPTAMFSSMAIPVVFQSSNHNGRLLADGGLVNNFPTDVAKRMGADIIIGVDIRNDFFDRKNLNSFNNIIGQLVNFFDQSKDSANNSLCDLIIRPDITGYTMSSFTNEAADTLIKRGELAAHALRSQLRKLKSDYHLSSLPRGRELVKPDKWPVTKVTFSGDNHLDPDFLLKTLALVIPGNLSSTDIITAIERLYGLGGFEHIHFNLVNDGNDTTLNITIKTSKVYTQNIGFRANTIDGAAILINTTRKNYRNAIGFLSASAELSINPGVELVAETNKTNLPTLGMQIKGKYQNYNIFDQGKKAFEANIFYSSASVYFYQPFWHFLQMGMGVQEEYYHGDIYSRNSTKIQGGEMDLFKTNAYAYFSFDNMDDFYFPSRGTNLYGEFSLMTDFKSTDKICPIALMKMKNVVPLSKNAALLMDAYGRAIFNPVYSVTSMTLVGGEPYSQYFNYHLPFVGLPAVSINGPYTYIGLLGVRFRLNRTQNVSILLNAMRSSNELLYGDNTEYTYGGGLRYSLKTMFGPLDMTLGYSGSTDKPNLSANFGFWF